MGDVTFTAETAFASNMRMELNQQNSLLAPLAMKRDCKGSEKKKLDNLISNHMMRKKTARNVQVVHDTTGWDGIWIAKPDPDYLATLVDEEDKLLTSVDLQGGEIMAHSGAYRRTRDAAFLEGFFGDLITGKTGTTLNSFPSGNVVAVDFKGPGVATANAGMLVAKLRRARRILAENFVNMQQQFYCGMTAQQVEDLTIDAQAISKDYTDAAKVKWSEDGKHLLSVAGFAIVEIELSNPLFGDAADLTLESTHRRCPFWTADGMVEGEWEELFTSVDKLPTVHFSAQVYSRRQSAFSRTDQNRCGYILCDE